MERDINSIAKEIDWFDFLSKLNNYYFEIDLDVKTWDDVVLKIFPKLYFFDRRFLENKQLTSLKGSPKDFDGDFECRYNKLTSLEGAPEKVDGDFACGNNQLTSLEGAPKEVGGWFSCGENALTSLVGAPSKVGGGVWCNDNVNLPLHKIEAYKTYLTLSDSEKAPLTKNGHYFPTKEWEQKFRNP